MKIQDIIKTVRDNMEDKSFSEVLREARDTLGIVQYKASEHLGMTVSRLKTLEIGFFRVVPSETELTSICTLYELPIDKMRAKAKEHVDGLARQKKVNMSDG